MQNSESLQMIKEQLKIKSVELRKATEENSKVTKKFRDLVANNRDETAKLKKEIKKVQEEAETQRRQAVTATRLAKQSGINAGKIEAEQIEAAKNKEEEAKSPTTVNNALFVGSTAELQKLLKKNTPK